MARQRHGPKYGEHERNPFLTCEEKIPTVEGQYKKIRYTTSRGRVKKNPILFRMIMNSVPWGASNSENSSKTKGWQEVASASLEEGRNRR